MFAIQTVCLDGSNVATPLSDPTREMSHPRVSYSGQYITFTRYHNVGTDGLATENGDYTNTEICLMNADGTGLLTLIGATPGIIAANSSWLPGDAGIIFLSTADQTKPPQFLVYTFATAAITVVPTPGLYVSDPHWGAAGNQIAFAQTRAGENDSNWIMNSDGSNLRQLTKPVITPTGPPTITLGDYDPRLSPDGQRFVTNRYYGGSDFRVIRRNTNLIEPERDLSGPHNVDGVPDWSGDNQKIIFRHFSANLTVQDIWTMNPYGYLRARVPLATAYNYNHPNFFPAAGSSPTARFAVSARLVR